MNPFAFLANPFQWVLEELTNRLRAETAAPPARVRICNGTILSRAQYLVDIEQWGYLDARTAYGYMDQADIDVWTDAIATEARCATVVDD